MSKFLSGRLAGLRPYVPGEQPQERQYIKLNTNESPFPPSPLATFMARRQLSELNLYSDPDCRLLTGAACEALGINEDEIVFGNGSDEILNFAFAAFCDGGTGAVFPDITYGFYRVFADFYGINRTEIPLNSDFKIDPEGYAAAGKTVFIANPNAPTGIALPLRDIERIVESNPGNVVVIDEAYVDFGGQSALPLIRKCSNLLVVRTFSKSRSLAGGRLGFGIACPQIISDLNKVRFSTNPYNVNRMTMAAGAGAFADEEYFGKCVDEIKKNRSFITEKLKKLDFYVTDSSANFVFAKHATLSGDYICSALKERGILVRHFDGERIMDFNRITVGSAAEMEKLAETLEEIL
ncbi:MAG: histidinol-phosphate transaminase [Clostridia bacterium]|nr:histidinol-phosphate transaminase [Clostridia bacterium]